MTRDESPWLLGVFAGVFGFFCVLGLWSWFRQMLVRRSSDIIVEVSAQPFVDGVKLPVGLHSNQPCGHCAPTWFAWNSTGVWQRVVPVTIPSSAKPSKRSSSHAIIWRIEVWGRSGWLGAFMHPYEVKVLPSE